MLLAFFLSMSSENEGLEMQQPAAIIRRTHGFPLVEILALPAVITLAGALLFPKALELTYSACQDQLAKVSSHRLLLH